MSDLVLCLVKKSSLDSVLHLCEVAVCVTDGQSMCLKNRFGSEEDAVEVMKSESERILSPLS